MFKSWMTGVVFSALLLGSNTSWSLAERKAVHSSNEEWQVSTQEITDENSGIINLMSLEAANCSQDQAPLSQTANFTNPLDPLQVVVYSIVNVGESLWNMIERGRPVVTQKYDVATALPQGIKCWADLEGWGRPSSKLFKTTFTNKMGVTPVKMSYRIIYLTGGHIDGVGKYIGFATMQPVSVDVGWGYSFNVQASIPSVYNMGSRTEPVAAMQMSLNYSIESSMGHTTESHQFLISGTGIFEKLKDNP